MKATKKQVDYILSFDSQITWDNPRSKSLKSFLFKMPRQEASSLIDRLVSGENVTLVVK